MQVLPVAQELRSQVPQVPDVTVKFCKKSVVFRPDINANFGLLVISSILWAKCQGKWTFPDSFFSISHVVVHLMDGLQSQPQASPSASRAITVTAQTIGWGLKSKS